MNPSPKAFVLCVSGPSGSGKTSLCDRLAEDLSFARRSISVTTRPKRTREVSGKDYIFVNRDEFEKMKAAGEFIETAEVFGNWYGTPKSPLEEALAAGDIIVMDIDTVGAMNVKAALQDRCCTVFILPPSVDELKKRLHERKQNDSQDLQKRLLEAEREIAESKRYEFCIVNSEFEQAYRDLKQLVLERRSESA